MINVALVGGKVTDSLTTSIKDKDINVVKKIDKISDLWEDITENSSEYEYIDKIIVIPSSFLPITEMIYIEQILNLQSFILMNDLRCNLYFAIKDTDLYESIKEEGEEALIYRNTNILLFKELIIKNFKDLIFGKYDAKGLYHPDFLRKDEIDAQLDNSYNEEELSYEEVKKETNREIVDSYLENDEELQKELKERERDDRRNRGRKERPAKPEKVKPNRENKKSGSSGTSSSPINQVDDLSSFNSNKKRNSGKRENVIFRGILAVTGDRQSGVSTTVANLAEMYGSLKYRTLVIDLDYLRRSQGVLFKEFDEGIQLEPRVANGLLVSLANPKNLEEVVSVVSKNVSVLGISNESDKFITKFANRPFEQLYASTNLINLLSFAKSLYDIVIIDVPFKELEKIGSFLTYVDRVLICSGNSENCLNNLFEVEIEQLFNKNALVGQTLVSKSKLILTKYNKNSKIYNREANIQLVQEILYDIDDHNYHLEVIGLVPLSFDFERQFDSNKRIVKMNNTYENLFMDIIELID